MNGTALLNINFNNDTCEGIFTTRSPCICLKEPCRRIGEGHHVYETKVGTYQYPARLVVAREGSDLDSRATICVLGFPNLLGFTVPTPRPQIFIDRKSVV